MVLDKSSMALCRILTEAAGIRYRFFCEASGAAVYTTEVLPGQSPDQERKAAWDNEAKSRFNFCGKCGRWICDAMYNADVCLCVDCAPWEGAPSYCKRCGTRIATDHLFCGLCGERAQYGEVWA